MVNDGLRRRARKILWLWFIGSLAYIPFILVKNIFYAIPLFIALFITGNYNAYWHK